MERILAFGCHPDDVEFMCAGTLALLSGKGFEVHIATMTDGDLGYHPGDDAAKRDRVRLKEAGNAAEILNGRYHYAGGHDLEVEYGPAYRRMATRVVREVDPAIIFTLPPMDYLADHEQASLLVRNAAYIASVPRYDCGTPTTPTKRFPHLYYWNAAKLKDIFGRPLPLHFGIDVGAVMETKERMLACHESQRRWLSYHNGFDSYLQVMKERTQEQGKSIGRQYGECFIQHLGGGHPRDNILKELLGELCIEIRE